MHESKTCQISPYKNAFCYKDMELIIKMLFLILFVEQLAKSFISGEIHVIFARDV